MKSVLKIIALLMLSSCGMNNGLWPFKRKLTECKVSLAAYKDSVRIKNDNILSLKQDLSLLEVKYADCKDDITLKEVIINKLRNDYYNRHDYTQATIQTWNRNGNLPKDIEVVSLDISFFSGPPFQIRHALCSHQPINVRPGWVAVQRSSSSFTNMEALKFEVTNSINKRPYVIFVEGSSKDLCQGQELYSKSAGGKNTFLKGMLAVNHGAFWKNVKIDVYRKKRLEEILFNVGLMINPQSNNPTSEALVYISKQASKKGSSESLSPVPDNKVEQYLASVGINPRKY
jgi:hypothetical protein